jgi:hypothetical protein
MWVLKPLPMRWMLPLHSTSWSNMRKAGLISTTVHVLVHFLSTTPTLFGFYISTSLQGNFRQLVRTLSVPVIAKSFQSRKEASFDR